MHFDPTSFIGLAGIPLIEQAVQFFKIEFRIPAYFAPLLALAVGIVLNDALAIYLHQSLTQALLVGLGAGFGSSFWHEFSK